MILSFSFVIHCVLDLSLYCVCNSWMLRCEGTAVMFMSKFLWHMFMFTCCKIVAGSTRILLFPCYPILFSIYNKKSMLWYGRHCISLNRRRCQPHVCMFLSFPLFLGVGEGGSKFMKILPMGPRIRFCLWRSNSISNLVLLLIGFINLIHSCMHSCWYAQGACWYSNSSNCNGVKDNVDQIIALHSIIKLWDNNLIFGEAIVD